MSSSSRAVVAAILLGACAQNRPTSLPTPDGNAPTGDVWWAPELGLRSLESIPARIEQPFDEPFEVVAMQGGQVRSASAPNCSTALMLVGKGYLPMADVDAVAFKLEVSKCQALQWLGGAKPAGVGSLASFRLDAEALSVLPPALGPEPNPQDVEDREAATIAGTSWQARDPESRVTTMEAGHAKVQGADWTTEMTLLGRGDFDADGRDDILLQTLAYGTEGSWKEVRLHQLTADDGKPVLRLAKQVRW
jgi:hypothetical protein